MKDELKEEILVGGQSQDSVIRIGDTVRRTVGENSAYVHSVLQLLEQKGYQFSPRLIGVDGQGREILSFIQGDVGRDVIWTDKLLISVARKLKEFHDITEGSELCKDKEVVCHRDLAPWNTVLRDGDVIGFIDFDGAEPGYRVEDLAYVLWTFLELGNTDIALPVQLSRIKLICKAYGQFNTNLLVPAITKEQERVLKIRQLMSVQSPREDIRNFSAERIKSIANQIKWVKDNKDQIESMLGVT